MNAQDSSHRQQIDWLSELFVGLQQTGFTGVVKIHMHDGGVRGARREEAIDLDWRAA